MGTLKDKKERVIEQILDQPNVYIDLVELTVRNYVKDWDREQVLDFLGEK